ncbi:MAG: hypothetical protein K8J09_16210, partial [Planctomycetes bacterium]|nr:hypothetical protein [Planctomycetota bacterium]
MRRRLAGDRRRQPERTPDACTPPPARLRLPDGPDDGAAASAAGQWRGFVVEAVAVEFVAAVVAGASPTRLGARTLATGLGTG